MSALINLHLLSRMARSVPSWVRIHTNSLDMIDRMKRFSFAKHTLYVEVLIRRFSTMNQGEEANASNVSEDAHTDLSGSA
jgi:hypothetical protein